MIDRSEVVHIWYKITISLCNAHSCHVYLCILPYTLYSNTHGPHWKEKRRKRHREKNQHYAIINSTKLMYNVFQVHIDFESWADQSRAIDAIIRSVSIIILLFVSLNKDFLRSVENLYRVNTITARAHCTQLALSTLILFFALCIQLFHYNCCDRQSWTL